MSVTLTIDGGQVSAREESTILEAAASAGIVIPTLCYHQDLTDTGACRLCVVSIAGTRGLQTACTTPVSEGMVVDTDSTAVREGRAFVLEMLLSDHPNDCITCEVDGDCDLQRWAYEYQVAFPDQLGRRHDYPIDADPSPVVVVDMNKCILCGRCVRACYEVEICDVWNIAQRGFATAVVAGASQTMQESGCVSCGNCVAYCPVGALFDRPSLGWGRAIRQRKVRTTCNYCGVGCQFDLNVNVDTGRITRVTSTPEAPVNGMALCVKGRYGSDFIHSDERLTAPLIRDASALGGRFPGFREASWDEALGLVAEKLVAARDTCGPDSVGYFSSAKCTNEENYLLQKLARGVVGTNNVDHCARL